ncbi:hypothetical protein EDB19DRAFT_2041319 [Suillus lakei]|nr:hypothetical protein EDB19DRAFT_2041319 [Suillus lakei]
MASIMARFRLPLSSLDLTSHTGRDGSLTRRSLCRILWNASFGPDSAASFSPSKYDPYALPIGRTYIDGWMFETLDPYTKENYAIPSTRCTRVVAVDYAGLIPVAANSMVNSALPRSYSRWRSISRAIHPCHIQQGFQQQPTKPSGKSTRRRHDHMHTREEVGIAVETAQDVETSFAWAPPLSTEPRDADDLLAGPESISPDNVAAEFAALKELKRTEEIQSIDEDEVLEGNVFDFDEEAVFVNFLLSEFSVSGDGNPKESTLNAAASKLKERFPNASGAEKTADACKNKWQSLKSAYNAVVDIKNTSGFT